MKTERIGIPMTGGKRIVDAHPLTRHFYAVPDPQWGGFNLTHRTGYAVAKGVLSLRKIRKMAETIEPLLNWGFRSLKAWGSIPEEKKQAVRDALYPPKGKKR